MKSCTVAFQPVCEAVDESTLAVAKRIESVPVEEEPMINAILIAKLKQKQSLGEDYVILKNTLIGKNTICTTQFAIPDLIFVSEGKIILYKRQSNSRNYL